MAEHSGGPVVAWAGGVLEGFGGYGIDDQWFRNEQVEIRAATGQTFAITIEGWSDAPDAATHVALAHELKNWAELHLPRTSS